MDKKFCRRLDESVTKNVLCSFDLFYLTQAGNRFRL